MPDYSHVPLLQKLGYQPGQTICLQHPPAGFADRLSQNGLEVKQLPADWLHVFFDQQAEAEQFFKQLDFNKIGVGLWASWPKKSSRVKTDMNEFTYRDLILPTGWVDVKVCSIDDTWSGFKFVRRKN